MGKAGDRYSSGDPPLPYHVPSSIIPSEWSWNGLNAVDFLDLDISSFPWRLPSRAAENASINLLQHKLCPSLLFLLLCNSKPNLILPCMQLTSLDAGINPFGFLACCCGFVGASFCRVIVRYELGQCSLRNEWEQGSLERYCIYLVYFYIRVLAKS